MDATGAEARERLAKWVEETRHIFSLPLLPELLANDSNAGEQVKLAEREIEKLRKELQDLKRENQQLRDEKEEVALVMGRIAQKLGVPSRKSPFERSPGAEPPKPSEPPRLAEPPRP